MGNHIFIQEEFYDIIPFWPPRYCNSGVRLPPHIGAFVCTDSWKAFTVRGKQINRKEEKNKFLAFLHKMPKWTKILSIIILAILLFVGFLVGTKPGKQLMSNIVVNFIFGKINVDPSEEDITPGLTITEVPEFTMTPTPQCLQFYRVACRAEFFSSPLIPIGTHLSYRPHATI